jgi:hypothetical protein
MYGKHERKQALAISTGPWWNDGQLTSRRWSGIYYLRSDYFFVLKKIKFFYFFICFKLIFIWCLIILNVKNNVWKIKKMILIYFQTKSIITILSNTPLIATKMIPQFLNALMMLGLCFFIFARMMFLVY